MKTATMAATNRDVASAAREDGDAHLTWQHQQLLLQSMDMGYLADYVHRAAVVLVLMLCLQAFQYDCA